MDDVRQRVAYNLRRLRAEKGLTQEKLAFSSQVDRSYISLLERGKFAASIDILQRVAKALKVDVEELVRPQPRRAK